MANVDRPNGFRPVKTFTGAPVSSLIRYITPSTDDIFVGDPITIASGAATQMAVEGICAGVCVGVATVNDEGAPMMYDPANLEKGFFDTSADVEADFRIAYVPSDDVLFEAQFDDTEDVVIGEAYDILATDGDTTTGRSKMEINGDALTNDGDVSVIESPIGGGYDQTSGEANKRVWVKFNNTLFDSV